MATDNRGWGHTRIQGALANLDHDVSRGTIATILREHRLTKHEAYRLVSLAGHVAVTSSLTRPVYGIHVKMPKSIFR